MFKQPQINIKVFLLRAAWTAVEQYIIECKQAGPQRLAGNSRL